MRLLLLLEAAEDAARDSGGACLFNATHLHAHVGRLYDNGDAPGADYFHDSISDLFSEAFLNLQPS